MQFEPGWLLRQLDAASAVVSTWPERKQNLLGRGKPMDRLPKLKFADLLNMALLNEGEGITQLELANRTGLTIGAISMLCTNQRQPRFETVRRIASVLSRSPAYWLD